AGQGDTRGAGGVVEVMVRVHQTLDRSGEDPRPDHLVRRPRTAVDHDRPLAVFDDDRRAETFGRRVRAPSTDDRQPQSRRLVGHSVPRSTAVIRPTRLNMLPSPGKSVPYTTSRSKS